MTSVADLFFRPMTDARGCYIFWPHFDFDRPEYPGIPHVYVCTSSGAAFSAYCNFFKIRY